MVVKKHGYPGVCRASVIKSPEFKQGADAERPGRGVALSRGAAARRQDRLHEVPHRAGLSRRSATRSTRRSSASPPSSRAPATR